MRGKPNPFTSSEFIVLGLIYEKPSYGYDLHKQITDPDNLGMIWHINMSNLYALLEKLAQKGYIQGAIKPGETHPNRTEYKISPEGKKAFKAWLGTTVLHPRDFRNEFMSRFYFLLKLLPDQVTVFCAKQLDECRLWLSKIKIETEHSVFKGSVLRFRYKQIKAIVEWLEEINQSLKSNPI